jgi:hypothetical protein
MPIDFASVDFDQAVSAAGHRAFLATLAAGRPVFYLDNDRLNVMEQPDGRRFEIRWIPGGPSGSNYEVVREVSPRKA